MPTILLDPDRERPDPVTCYAADPKNCEGHAGWRHAKSWDEVQEHLHSEAEARDPDSDRVTKIFPHRNVVNLEGEGDNEWHYTPFQILLEDVQVVPPTSPEEEDEAMRSIMEAFSKNRLS